MFPGRRVEELWWRPQWVLTLFKNLRSMFWSLNWYNLIGECIGIIISYDILTLVTETETDTRERQWWPRTVLLGCRRYGVPWPTTQITKLRKLQVSRIHASKTPESDNIDISIPLATSYNLIWQNFPRKTSWRTLVATSVGLDPFQKIAVYIWKPQLI